MNLLCVKTLVRKMLYETNQIKNNFLFFTNFKSRYEVVFTRCLLGHTRFTHGYLLKVEEPPSRQTKMTVKHILLDCWIVFNVNSQRFYSEVNI